VTGFRVLGNIVLGDLRERTRRYSFIWIMLATTVFGYLVITGKYGMTFPGFQVASNSAWVGSHMAMFCTLMLGLVGFYMIRNTVERDRRTGVGQIIAATPLNQLTYLLAKFASNFLVLIGCTVVLVSAAILLQATGGQIRSFHLGDLLAPFLVITLPVLLMVAGAAVLFETVRWLRGTVGNILYLLVVETLILQGIVQDAPAIDLIGAHAITSGIEEAILAVAPGTSLAVQVGALGLFDTAPTVAPISVIWPGLDWTISLVWPRLGYAALGIVLTLIAAALFDRFDPSRTRRRRPGKRKKTGVAPDSPGRSPNRRTPDISLAPVTVGFKLTTLILSELRVMLKGYHWVWYVVALGIPIAQIAAPYDIARTYLLPAALIWPLPLWSALGTRDSRYGTQPLLTSSPHPLIRRLSSAWLGGLIISAVLCSGMAIKAVLAGQLIQAAAVAAGAVFVPTTALMLGAVAGSRKFFEVGYFMVWYVGMVDHVWAFDFVGVTDEGLAHGAPWVFLSLAGLFLPLAVLGQVRRQIES